MTDLLQRIATLPDELPASTVTGHDGVHTHGPFLTVPNTEYVAALQSRLALAVELLKPLAQLDIAHRERDPDDRIVLGINDTNFTLGDIRAARAFLEKVK